MFKLSPTNTQFYDFFDRASDVLVRASAHFLAAIDAGADPQLVAEEMTTMEHQCDEITHDALNLLHKSFITPLERGDIRRLSISLDDVLDCLDDATRRIALYKLNPSTMQAVRGLAQVLVKTTLAVQQAVHEIRNLRKSGSIRSHCIEVHRCEDEGDRMFQIALAGLFDSGMETLDVVKWKDIIEDLENAIDACQDVALVIEAIILEHS